jgi:hypothetical protein
LANQHTKGADKRLSEQQEKFCEHFLKFGNATRAAEQAGYTHPDIQAIRLLSKPHIKQFLQRAVQARAMGFAPEMMEVLANLALDAENVQPKDRVAAAIAVLDRANIPNGKSGPTINVDARTQNMNVTGEAVQRLIAQTYNRGQGAPALPPPDVPVPEVDDEEAEFSPVDEAVDSGED